MAGKITRLEAMARNPQGNWNISDIETICREYGLSCNPPRGGGSHYKIAADEFVLMIPAKRRIKPVYIRSLVGLIRKIRDRRA